MDEGRPGSVSADRERVRRRYGRLFEEVSEILFRHDPIGINFGDNTDEYEPEVGTILPHLEDAYSEAEVLDVVHREFAKWFEPATAGARSEYTAIAEEVWTAWQRYEAARDRR